MNTDHSTISGIGAPPPTGASSVGTDDPRGVRALATLEETLRTEAAEIKERRHVYRKARRSALVVPCCLAALMFNQIDGWMDGSGRYTGRMWTSIGIYIAADVLVWSLIWCQRHEYRRRVLAFGLLLERLERNELGVSVVEEPLDTLTWHVDNAVLGSGPDGNLAVLRPLREGAVAVRSWDMEHRKAWDELLRATKDARWKLPVPDPST